MSSGQNCECFLQPLVLKCQGGGNLFSPIASGFSTLAKQEAVRRVVFRFARTSVSHLPALPDGKCLARTGGEHIRRAGLLPRQEPLRRRRRPHCLASCDCCTFTMVRTQSKELSDHSDARARLLMVRVNECKQQGETRSLPCWIESRDDAFSPFCVF